MTRQPDKRNSKMNPIKLKFAAFLIALLVLPSCGGGGSGSINPDASINPPSAFYGAMDTGYRGTGCSAGWGIGVATGYSSESAAKTAAVNECRRAGSTSDCGSGIATFGSAYRSACRARAYGDSSGGGCGLRSGSGATLTAARADALSDCQNELSSCRIAAAACSTSGPADSFYRIASAGGGNTGSGNTGNNSGGNTGSGNTGNNSGGNTGSGNTGNNWGYYAIIGSSCTGNGRRGWSLNSGYSDQASANSVFRSVCSSRGGCPTGDTFQNDCVGVATSDRCGYAVRWGSSEASAQNLALTACRNNGGSNCESAARCAGNP